MVSVCTFFGHRDCPDSIRPRLRAELETLISQQDVDTFYVGNQGQFDAMVRSVLRELQKEFPHIRYAVVLAYVPGTKTDGDFSDTMLPEGIEAVHPRYAISWRNNWMLRQSDVVVTYITHSWGGAAHYTSKGEKQGKQMVRLGVFFSNL